jgi:hypothetical protein
MPDEKTFHMSPDEFRRHGHAVVDWIADYYERIESYPVLSRVEAGQVRASLPPNPPVKGEPFAAILGDVEKLILPGITHWQSPNFFAFFPANASGRRFLGTCFPPDWECKGCFGRPVRRALSWKRTSSIGWLKCSACRRSFCLSAPEAA